MNRRMCHFEMDKFEEAKKAFETGAQVDPSSKTIRAWIRKCCAELASDINNPFLFSLFSFFLFRFSKNERTGEVS